MDHNMVAIRRMREHPLVISIWLDEPEYDSSERAYSGWNDLDKVNDCSLSQFGPA